MHIFRPYSRPLNQKLLQGGGRISVLTTFSDNSVCCVASAMSDSFWLWTVACQVPLSMGFSRQESWSRLPCPPPGDLPDPGIEPKPFRSPALAGRFFTVSATWEALWWFECRSKLENQYSRALLFQVWSTASFTTLTSLGCLLQMLTLRPHPMAN